MPSILAEDKKEILKNIKGIKAKGLLPTHYAKAINERYPELKSQKIHDVANGKYFNAEIVDALLELAAENRDQQRLAKSKDLLNND